MSPAEHCSVSASASKRRRRSVYPRTATREEELVDRIFDVADSADDDTKWISAVTLLASVLGDLDEVARKRKLRGLVEEVNEAITGIEKIMHGKGGLQ
jgi:hypothetical protein